MRGAVGYAGNFTFLIYRGCNVCDRDRKRVYGEKKTINQEMDKYVDGCWISLVWVRTDGNAGMQEKTPNDRACWIFMHIHAEVSRAWLLCSKILVSSDADPRYSVM